METRVGVDIGGTFTDLVFHDARTGRTRVAKEPTTPERPDVGVMKVVDASVGEDALQHAAYFLHGMTVGINALLERKGARVGLLTTDGFRDVLEMRRGTRGEALYDLRYQPQPALVPRHLRVGVRERILSDGTVERDLDEQDIAHALELYRLENVEAIAVCFINAYAHPKHELEAEEILRRLGFKGSITLSHRLSRELGEFERTATSVVDAYVRPAVSEYLARLDDGLRTSGFGGQSLITRSGGGSMTFAEAEARPFETVMSGPVAGAIGAGVLAQTLGLSRAIAADVGGTSFDTCLLREGRPLTKYEGYVGDLPLQTSWVDVRSIGSGGGSIAYLDGDSPILRVGPESSGAVPGPVCYGRGGTRPTTTDAAAVLGMLGFGELAGGMSLDIAAAERSIDELGAKIGLSRDETASGVITIASAAMAGAVRSVTIEQGEDPREAALIAFGGAGPMLATVIARELDISSIVVPEHAGNFSAASLLGQDVMRCASATLIRPLDSETLSVAHVKLAELQRELERRSEGSATREGRRTLDAALEMRYMGQFNTLTIAWPAPSSPADAAALAQAFGAEYEKVFGHTLETPVEIVAVRTRLRERLPDLADATSEDEDGTVDRRREAYSFELGKRVEFVVRERCALGEALSSGPLIVLEPTTTSYIDVGWTVSVGPRGALLITRKESNT